MKARFIGDPSDNFSGPDVHTAFGVEFVKGKWVDDLDPTIFAKLEGNPAYETAGGADDKKVAAKKASAVTRASAGKAERASAVKAKFTKDRPRDKKPEVTSKE